MAIIAVVPARDVSRVFARCRNTVMAGIAGTQYLRVIDCHDRCPQICSVAVLADVRRLHVSRVFSCRVRAVMAAHAVPGNVYVAEVRW